MRSRHFSYIVIRYMKPCAIFIIVLFLVESVVFNIVMIYTFWNIRNFINVIMDASGRTFFDKLAASSVFQDFVESGKEGGFASLLQNTVERIYVESYEDIPQSVSLNIKNNAYQNQNRNNSRVKVSRIGFDVSDSGEALYIYRRIQKRKHRPWVNLVVDIGANDGLLSSNSYNFIQWGWSALLVEPQAYQISLARRNLIRYIDPYNEGNQSVKFLQGVISDHDGYVRFKISPDMVAMESHVLEPNEYASDQDVVLNVKCYSVKTLASMFDIPRQFGILSIDAERSSSVILHQFIKLGFRPAYIIYEDLHDREPVHVTSSLLQDAGYRLLSKRGWNHIYENTQFVTADADGWAGYRLLSKRGWNHIYEKTQFATADAD